MSWLYTIVVVGMMLSGSSETIRLKLNTADPNIRAIRAQQTETERVEKSFPLNANGRVSVSNVNGSINVIAWDQNEVKLVAIKTADTKEHLQDVQIQIDARPDYISIETDYGDDRTWKGDSDKRWRNNDKVTVEYELNVPRTATLNEIETVNGSVTLADFSNFVKVSAVNGTVRASNLRGTADLSTVNGEVVADFDKLATGSTIALETVNGRVNLTIPSDSNATVKAESLNGVISNDFGLPNRRGKYVGNSLHGRLGRGDATIKLESVNGPLNVKRRNDGKQPSPAVNLLPAKGADDDDWDGEVDLDKQEILKINRDIDRNVRESKQRALKDAQKEISKLKIELPKIADETTSEIMRSIDTESIQRSIKDSMESQKAALAGLRDANFLLRSPRVETKNGSFAVKGTPKVIVDARGCDVRVRGWDNAEVKYSLTQLKAGRSDASPVVTQDQTDSTVTLKVTETDESIAVPFMGGSTRTLIEVLVPRRSNLKIVSDGEIRLDGVSGELEIVGGDEPVNVRDSDGKLSVTNEDGRVRVIGFSGDVTAQTGDGDIYLEGSFSKLIGRGSAGTFVVTLPTDASADIMANTDVESNGLELLDKGNNHWKLGSGGPSYSFQTSNGEVIIRSSSTLGTK